MKNILGFYMEYVILIFTLLKTMFKVEKSTNWDK